MIVLRIFDSETGELMDEMPYSPDEMCSGARRGATSEMCGGCCGCIALQCQFYGTPYEIVEIP